MQHYLGIGAEYENYYYTVESPGAQSYSLNAHEYLHSIVNPIVARGFESQREKLERYYEIGKDGPYAKSYQRPATYAQECMVRALDHRLRLAAADPQEQSAVEARVDELTKNGLILVRPFYDLLEDFEESESTFADYIVVLLKRLPPKAEE